MIIKFYYNCKILNFSRPNIINHWWRRHVNRVNSIAIQIKAMAVPPPISGSFHFLTQFSLFRQFTALLSRAFRLPNQSIVINVTMSIVLLFFFSFVSFDNALSRGISNFSSWYFHAMWSGIRVAQPRCSYAITN